MNNQSLNVKSQVTSELKIHYHVDKTRVLYLITKTVTKGIYHFFDKIVCGEKNKLIQCVNLCINKRKQHMI